MIYLTPYWTKINLVGKNFNLKFNLSLNRMINNLLRSCSFKGAYIYIFSLSIWNSFIRILHVHSTRFPFLQTFYTIITKLSFLINSPSNVSHTFAHPSQRKTPSEKKKNYQEISLNNKFVKKSKESKLAINFWNSFLWQIIPQI